MTRRRRALLGPAPAHRVRAFVMLGLLAILAMLGGSPSVTSAQLVRGVVVEAATREPVPGAFAALIDTTADVVYGATTDARGRFSLPVRAPGIYAVVTTHAGYLRQVSDWIEIAASDTFEVTTRLARPATTLSPIVIKAQRDSLRALGTLGLSSKAIGGTIVTPAEVSAAAMTSTSVYGLVESLHVPGLEVKNLFVETGPRLIGGFYNCIVYRRTGSCVTVVIDGMKYSDFADLAQLDNLLSGPAISYMVFLRPHEAGVLYGTTESAGGVLLVVTKGGGR